MRGGGWVRLRPVWTDFTQWLVRAQRTLAYTWRRRRLGVTARLGAVVLVVGLVPTVGWFVAQPALAGTTSITIEAHDLTSGTALSDFQYVVNVDNSRLPNDADPAKRTGFAPTESNSPIVAEGDQDRATVDLPDGRYLISIRSTDHKMWGKHITLPQDAGTVRIDMSEASLANPLPLGKIRVFVFNDNRWTNGAPDTDEAGLAGFHITLEEQTDSIVSVDYYNQPLCGGDCVTESDGFKQIDNLSPATYFIYVTPPTSCGPGGSGHWTQTTTIDGGLGLQAGAEEGSDGSGAPGESLWEPPNRRTAFWFGFVCTATSFGTGGSGVINAQAHNWQGWPPYDTLTMGETVEQPFVALSNSANDTTVYVGRGDSDGNIHIPSVPAGTYNMAVWDEQLNYIMRFVPVVVGAGQTVNLGDVGVSRWFGWLDGYVYFDNGIAANGVSLPAGAKGNGKRDCMDANDQATCEAGIANTDVDQRWRDGSIKEDTVTDPNGYYQYPTAEGGSLGKWFIGEVGFTRFGTSGASVHDEYNGAATHVPSDLGGNLLTNQLLTEGHRATVDWGKYQYNDIPAGQIGQQIVGITYYATTRNEFDPRFAAHENYEPAIPDVEVRLEGLGPDSLPNTPDDVVLNDYMTDHYSPPSGCDVRDASGADISSQLNPTIGPNCLEVPITGEETKDGAFDGGYAFADYCPATRGGLNLSHFQSTGESVCGDGGDPEALVPGTYITHVLMPTDASDTRPCNPDNPNGFKNVTGPTGPSGRLGCLYKIEREEDVNVDLGAQFTPAIPPPSCTGDNHVIDQSTLTNRSPYFGVSPSPSKPLCDKRLIVLTANQNANADFFLFTNFSNGADVAEPGRLVGLVSDDIYFDNDPQSIWYGEPRPVGNIPIGIRDYNMRLLTTVNTSQYGAYEAVLPSTETFNCPIPQGPCPGMYIVVVNDPGDKAHPNANYNPNYLTASSAWDIWPGQTDQLDTPLDPISGTGCELPVAMPELLQVSKPYIHQGDSVANRTITIDGTFFGNTAGSVVLTDTPSTTRTLTTGNGGIVSWADRQIKILIPVEGTGGAQIRSGPKQLSVVTSAGVSTSNGLTFHVLGTAGQTYNPTVVNVASPTTPHAIQNAIDAAASDNLLVLQPGVYHENVLMWKRVKLQGLGPGGTVGASETAQRDPEDPRFAIQGTSIDGRFFQDNAAGFDATLASIGSLAGVNATHPVLRGAGITVVSKTQTSFIGGLNAARIDGIGVTTGTGQGAGGIQLQAYVQHMQVTNNILESNGGIFAGGLAIGQPYFDTNNIDTHVTHNRFMGNGGLTRSGAIGVFRSSNNYEFGNNIVCSNFGVEYGAGFSHWGRSDNGSIHDNLIYYNDSVDSGAGIAIAQEIPIPGPTPTLGAGTGPVDIDRNLVEGNYSGDDGGGIFIENAHTFTINIRNNMIVDNGSADLGGAIMLDDSSQVRIINNTVANNVSTASCETCDASPHAAGLAAEANDPLFQATLPVNANKFSNPTALYNNIFWNNEAFHLSQSGPGATLVSDGFIDFEVHGVVGNNSATFTPRYSLLTNGNILGPNGVIHGLPTGQNNIIGQDPQFLNEFTLELTVAGSRLDPQMAAVTITGADPPVGLAGNYHIATTSPAIDRGPATNNSIAAPTVDYDNQTRPQSRSTRTTKWDLGADEILAGA